MIAEQTASMNAGSETEKEHGNAWCESEKIEIKRTEGGGNKI